MKTGVQPKMKAGVQQARLTRRSLARFAALVAWVGVSLSVAPALAQPKRKAVGPGGVISPAAARPPAPTMTPAAAAHVEVGRALAKSKRYTEAAREFESAVRLQPGDGVLISEYGWLIFLADAPAQAEPVIRNAITLLQDPENLGAAWYNLGRVFEKTGRIDEAARAYHQSMALRPNKVVQLRLAGLKRSTPVEGPPPAGEASLSADRGKWIPCDIVLLTDSWRDMQEGDEDDGSGSGYVPTSKRERVSKWALSGHEIGEALAFPPFSLAQLKALGAQPAGEKSAWDLSPARLSPNGIMGTTDGTMTFVVDGQGRTVKSSFSPNEEAARPHIFTFTYRYSCP